jgi:uncharacterized protein YerC
MCYHGNAPIEQRSITAEQWCVLRLCESVMEKNETVDLYGALLFLEDKEEAVVFVKNLCAQQKTVAIFDCRQICQLLNAKKCPRAK